MADKVEDRRSDLRVSARLRVEFTEKKNAASAFKAFSLNLSPGGICIRSKKAYPVETRLSLHLTIDGENFRLLGAVAWARGEVLGIRFVNPTQAQREQLERLVQAQTRDGAPSD